MITLHVSSWQPFLNYLVTVSLTPNRSHMQSRVSNIGLHTEVIEQI